VPDACAGFATESHPPGSSASPRGYAHAVHGDVKKGLFFRGSEPLPLAGAMRPVAELFDYLLGRSDPQLDAL
jgi:hypothetical protein